MSADVAAPETDKHGETRRVAIVDALKGTNKCLNFYDIFLVEGVPE